MTLQALLENKKSFVSQKKKKKKITIKIYLITTSPLLWKKNLQRNKGKNSNSNIKAFPWWLIDDDFWWFQPILSPLHAAIGQYCVTYPTQQRSTGRSQHFLTTLKPNLHNGKNLLQDQSTKAASLLKWTFPPKPINLFNCPPSLRQRRAIKCFAARIVSSLAT